MPNTQALTAGYEKLSQQYIAAFHDEESARVTALKTLDAQTIEEWQRACRTTENINNRRIALRLELLYAMNRQERTAQK